ncbi:MAG TPA: Coenzyme F420 hydrogenase/dehydrogenase, beta subunit C-terminal domain [Methanomicrobiales archaeon]|jgi:coenzyme F420 hydrogenase subunit beta|nr:Coenzyme F420 hydrogenase/dehydrogenase, beta subunit C-terminal domain [Methanomicrobiales archaeon]
MTGKSYRDLKRDVWDAGLCSGCGACIAVCPSDGLYFEAGKGAPSPVSTGTCKEDQAGVPCGVCIEVCPRASGETREMLGEYSAALAAKAGFEIPRRQSGGAVTAILAAALDEGLIDGVVTVTEDRFTLEPRSAIITSSGALVHEAGSRYSWWVPLLASLKEAVVRQKLRRVAVVGVPCAVQAVRRMMESDNQLARPYGRSIRLLVGLFCTETFDYRTLVGDILGGKHGVEPWQVKRLDVAGKLEVTVEGRDTIAISLKELGAAVRPGCRSCTDFTAVDADISAGAVGAPKGYTTLLVRTPVGKSFVDRAVSAGKLVTEPKVDLAAVEKLAREKAKRKNRVSHPA